MPDVAVAAVLCRYDTDNLSMSGLPLSSNVSIMLCLDIKDEGQQLTFIDAVVGLVGDGGEHDERVPFGLQGAVKQPCVSFYSKDTQLEVKARARTGEDMAK
jgi:hypothetical protein